MQGGEAKRILDYIGTCLTFLAVFFAGWQIYLARIDAKNDHERSRRELSLNLCANWAEGLIPQTFELLKLFDSLPRDIISSLVLNEECTIDAKYENQIRFIFKDMDTDDYFTALDNGSIKLTKRGVQQLRFTAINYLNRTESVLCSWWHGVGDKAILEEQFAPLLDESKGKNAMSTFRNAIGVEHHPAFHAFILHLQRKRSSQNKPRGEVG